MGAVICSGCHSTERPQAFTKSWAWVLAVLGLFCVPLFGLGVAMILVAMFVGRGQRCRGCKCELLIPLNSPRGQQMVKDVVAQGYTPPKRRTIDDDLRDFA